MKTPPCTSSTPRLHYLITPNMEIGAIVAFGPQSHGLNILTNIGIGVRF